MRKIVIVGEVNPYSIDPKYALFDYPVNSAGWCLRTKIFQVRRSTYLGMHRINLCSGTWDIKQARAYAQEILNSESDCFFILLGRKVTGAFFEGKDLPAAMTASGNMLILPHPSGINKVWNAETRAQARALLTLHLPEIPWGQRI